MKFQIIKTDLLTEYLKVIPKGLQQKFNALKDAELSTLNFSFYTSVASVFSSKIEGENIELDSYIKHKCDNISFKPDYTKKIDDLYSAYIFAQQNQLNEKNIKEIHTLLTKHILDSAWQGKFRTQNIYLASEDGNIEYVAASPSLVKTEMHKLINDLKILLNISLSIEETFYFASMLHLVFIKIHPWNDGNGRTARLIEKWFLAQKFGNKAWYMQSEKFYYNQHQTYYYNIRKLGLEYDFLDFSKALPLILMLPNCLK